MLTRVPHYFPPLQLTFVDCLLDIGCNKLIQVPHLPGQEKGEQTMVSIIQSATII